MNRQTLRDAQYKAIGYIETDDNGAQRYQAVAFPKNEQR
ncbi:hypothetical protein QO017_005545 [Methylobacterium gregans]|nr:hypothetical protein [Methylobacterium gregans]